MTKYFKKAVLSALLLLLVLSASVPAGAATRKQQAIKVYRTFLEKMSVNAKFSMIYLDNNTVPELIVQPVSYTNNAVLYTYKKGKMVKLGSTGLEQPGKYYKKKGVLMNVYAHGNIYGYLWAWDYYYVLSGTKLTRKFSKLTSSYKGKSSVTYTAGSKEVKKSVFNTRLKKYTGGKKASSIKLYVNTEINRTKYLK